MHIFQRRSHTTAALCVCARATNTQRFCDNRLLLTMCVLCSNFDHCLAATFFSMPFFIFDFMTFSLFLSFVFSPFVRLCFFLSHQHCETNTVFFTHSYSRLGKWCNSADFSVNDFLPFFQQNRNTLFQTPLCFHSSSFNAVGLTVFCITFCTTQYG